MGYRPSSRQKNKAGGKEVGNIGRLEEEGVWILANHYGPSDPLGVPKGVVPRTRAHRVKQGEPNNLDLPGLE